MNKERADGLQQNMHARMCEGVRVCLCVCICTCEHKYIYIYIYIYMCVCVNVGCGNSLPIILEKLQIS